MIFDGPTLFTLLVLFFAALVRSVFGFGEALIAVPLLAMLMPVEVAAPIAVLISVTVGVVALAQDWRHASAGAAGWLAVSSLCGIPLGLQMLKTVPAPVVKGMLAVMIIAFSTYLLIRQSRYELLHDRFAWMFGLVAGVLGGAYGMNGPPVVVYGSLRRWHPVQFRATLQGYFLPVSVGIMVGYQMSGLWTPTVSRYYLLSLPLLAVAIFLGRAINRRLDSRRFHSYVHIALVLIGVTLLFQAFRERSNGSASASRPSLHTDQSR